MMTAQRVSERAARALRQLSQSLESLSLTSVVGDEEGFERLILIVDGVFPKGSRKQAFK